MVSGPSQPLSLPRGGSVQPGSGFLHYLRRQIGRNSLDGRRHAMPDCGLKPTFHASYESWLEPLGSSSLAWAVLPGAGRGQPGNMRYARRSLSERAQRALEEALDALMAVQVCDEALDGSVQCGHEMPCVFHRTYHPARNKPVIPRPRREGERPAFSDWDPSGPRASARSQGRSG